MTTEATAAAVLLGLLAALPAVASTQGGKAPAFAGKGGSSSTNIVVPNSTQNNQHNTGSVDQAPIGGINQNSQINYQGQNDIGFGVGIFCRTPAAYVAGFGGGGGSSDFNSSNFGAAVGLNFPLGQANSNCLALSREVLLQRQLDTCLTLLRAGASFDPQVWPELERCRGLTVAAAPAEPITPPAPVPVPAPAARVVRGLW